MAFAILKDDASAAGIDSQDRRIYISARDSLAPLGLDVDRGARILVDAAKSAGGIDRVLEACRWFNRAQPNLRSLSTSEVVARFLRKLRADGASDIYISKMEDDLEKFVGRFPGMIGDYQAHEIDDWLLSLGIGMRRRRNFLTKLRTAFNFARDNGALPESFRTEVEKIKLPPIKRRAPAIYTPQEFRLILLQCYRTADRRSGRLDYSEFIPALTIGAFAGLRWAEIQRLDWQRDVHFDHGIIDVGDENKTGHRQVPILPNLAAWLRPWQGSLGKVCPFGRPDNIIHRLGKRAGLPVGARRYANALRHSYVSYRMAITKNAPVVSEECGHSIAELKKSYLRRQLEPAAVAWFEFAPDVDDNVKITPLFRQRRTA
jgi:integrase